MDIFDRIAAKRQVTPPAEGGGDVFDRLAAKKTIPPYEPGPFSENKNNLDSFNNPVDNPPQVGKVGGMTTNYNYPQYEPEPTPTAPTVQGRDVNQFATKTLEPNIREQALAGVVPQKRRYDPRTGFFDSPVPAELLQKPEGAAVNRKQTPVVSASQEYQDALADVVKNGMSGKVFDAAVKKAKTRFLGVTQQESVKPIEAQAEQRLLDEEQKGRKKDYVNEWVRAWDRGSANVVSGVLETVAFGTQPTDKDELSQYASAYQKAMTSPELAPRKNGDWIETALNTVGETMPYMTATVAAHMVAGPAGSFSVGAMVEGNSAYQNAKAAGVADGQARLIGLSVGIVNGAIENIGGGGGKYLKPIAAKKVGQKILAYGKDITKQALHNAMNEALEESTQELSTISGEKLYRNVSWDEAVTRVGQSAAAGAALGFGVSVGGAAINSVGKTSQETTQDTTEIAPEPPIPATETPLLGDLNDKGTTGQKTPLLGDLNDQGRTSLPGRTVEEMTGQYAPTAPQEDIRGVMDARNQQADVFDRVTARLKQKEAERLAAQTAAQAPATAEAETVTTAKGPENAVQQEETQGGLRQVTPETKQGAVGQEAVPVLPPTGRIQAIKNSNGKYEIQFKGSSQPVDNPFNKEVFSGEFETPQIARKSYEAWFLKQQAKPISLSPSDSGAAGAAKIPPTEDTKKPSPQGETASTVAGKTESSLSGGTPVVNQKEPWQQTRGEYVGGRIEWGTPIKTDQSGRIVDARNDLSVGDYVLGTSWDTEKGSSTYDAGKVVKVLKQAVDIETPQGIKRVGEKISKLSDKSAGILQKSDAHRKAVKEALSEGKPVPAEVLREYPDLALAAEKKKALAGIREQAQKPVSEQERNPALRVVNPEPKAPAKSPDKPVDAKKFYSYESIDPDTNTNGFVEVKGRPLKIPGYEQLDTFMTKLKDGTWSMTEGKSGLSMGKGKTQKAAFDKAKGNLDHVGKWDKEKGPKKTIEDLIAEQVEKSGLSPRYGGKAEPTTEKSTDITAQEKGLSDTVEKYGWSVKKNEKGTIYLHNRDNKPVVRVDIKGDKYKFSDLADTKVMDGRGPIGLGAKRLLTQMYYAKENTIPTPEPSKPMIKGADGVYRTEEGAKTESPVTTKPSKDYLDVKWDKLKSGEHVVLSDKDVDLLLSKYENTDEISRLVTIRNPKRVGTLDQYDAWLGSPLEEPPTVVEDAAGQSLVEFVNSVTVDRNKVLYGDEVLHEYRPGYYPTKKDLETLHDVLRQRVRSEVMASGDKTGDLFGQKTAPRPNTIITEEKKNAVLARQEEKAQERRKERQTKTENKETWNKGALFTDDSPFYVLSPYALEPRYWGSETGENRWYAAIAKSKQRNKVTGDKETVYEWSAQDLNKESEISGTSKTLKDAKTMAENAVAELRKKAGLDTVRGPGRGKESGQFQILDKEDIQLAADLLVYYVERGARTAKYFVDKAVEIYGEPVREHLPAIWAEVKKRTGIEGGLPGTEPPNTQKLPNIEEGVFYRSENLDTLSEKNKGLIILTDNRSTAAMYERAGKGRRISNEYDAEEYINSGQEAKDLSAVKAYRFTPKKTLNMDENGLVVLRNLDDEGNPRAKKIIDDAKNRIRNNTSSLYWWQNTLPETQEAWKNVLGPQLKELGYDSIRYTDDVNTGSVLAVFDRSVLSEHTPPTTTPPTKPAPVETPAQEPPATEPPSPPVSTTGPVETPKPKQAVHNVAQSAENAAIDSGLIAGKGGLGPLPTHDVKNMEAAQAAVAEIFKADPERGMRIAMGEEAAPKGQDLNAVDFFTHARKDAMARADGELITKLINSPLAKEGALESGRRVQSYDTGNRSDIDAFSDAKDIDTAAKDTEQKRQGRRTNTDLQNDLAAKDKKDREIGFDRIIQKEIIAQQSKDTGAGPRPLRPKNEYGSKNKIVTKDRHTQNEARLKSILSGELRTGLDPRIVEIGIEEFIYHAEAIGRRGTTLFAEVSAKLKESFGEKITPYLKTIYDGAMEKSRGNIVGDIKDALTENDGNILSIRDGVAQLAKQYIAEGVRGREPLIDKIHSDIKDLIPDWTREQTYNAVARYGEFREASKDEVEIEYRKSRGESLNVSKLKSMENGQAPLATGGARQPVGDEQRRLTKLVNEAKKKGGFVVVDPERQLKTALATKETRLRNRITDVKSEIASRQRLIKDKTPSPENDVTKALQVELDGLLAEHKAIFGNRKLTDQQKLDIATKYNEKAIAELDRKISTGDISKQATPDRPMTPELKALIAKKEGLQAQLKEMRDAAKPKKTQAELDAASVQKDINSTERSIGLIAAKIMQGDVRPTVKDRAQRPSTPELNALQDKLEQLQGRYKEIRAENVRLESTENATQRSIDDLQRRIDAGQTLPDAKSPAPSSATLSTLKARQATLRQELKQLQEADPAYVAERNRRSDALYEKNLAKRLKTLEDVIASGRYGEPKTPRQRQLSKEAQTIRDVLNTRRSLAKDDVGITPEQADRIAVLAKDAVDLQAKADDGGKGDFADPKDQEAYGLAAIKYRDYVNHLMNQANKKTWKDRLQHPLDTFEEAFYSGFGLAKAFRFTMDVSATGRQTQSAMTHDIADTSMDFVGVSFAKAVSKITGKGDSPSYDPKLSSFKNIWKSWVYAAKALGGREVATAIDANIVARKNYRNGLYKKHGLAVMVLEENLPVHLYSKTPVIGRVFNAAEAAFSSLQKFQRADIFDAEMELAKTLGLDPMTDAVKGIGKLTNSVTSRGNLDISKRFSFEPVADFLNLILTAVRMMKSDVDVWTGYQLNRDMSAFARKRGLAKSAKEIAVMAAVLALAELLKPGSVEWEDTKSTFGGIEIDDVIYMPFAKLKYFVLAARLAKKVYTTANGKVIKLNTGVQGQPTQWSVLNDFMGNRTSPFFSVFKDRAMGENFDHTKPTILGDVVKTTVPLTAETSVEYVVNKKVSVPSKIGAMVSEIIGWSTNPVEYMPTTENQKLKDIQKTFSKQLYSLPFEDLSPAQQNRINTIPEVVAQEKIKKAYYADKPDSFTEGTEEFDASKRIMAAFPPDIQRKITEKGIDSIGIKSTITVNGNKFYLNEKRFKAYEDLVTRNLISMRGNIADQSNEKDMRVIIDEQKDLARETLLQQIDSGRL
jgi:hypothetical protein